MLQIKRPVGSEKNIFNLYSKFPLSKCTNLDESFINDCKTSQLAKPYPHLKQLAAENKTLKDRAYISSTEHLLTQKALNRPPQKDIQT